MVEGNRIRLRGICLELDRNVYIPAEDSLLLLDSIEQLGNLNGKRCLDVGTGTGLAAIYMAKRGCETYATDISPKSVELARRNAKLNKVLIQVTQGNLLTHFRDRSFDLISFNPPYLPERPDPDSPITYAWAGGLNGREFLSEFLEDLSRVLSVEGISLFIFSDLNGVDWVVRTCNKKMRCRIVARRKLAFHEIMVMMAQNLM